MRGTVMPEGELREGLPVVVRIPGRDWMESALADLRGAGCAPVVVAGPDGEGCWTVAVTGPAGELGSLRQAVSAHAPDFCWNAFLNA